MKGLIQNLDALAISDARKDALLIAEAGYAAIDIETVIKSKIRIENGALHIANATYPLAGRRVFFVGIGKCATRGGQAIGKILGDALASGIVFDVTGAAHEDIPKMEIHVGTHPLPSEANAQGSERILEFLSGRDENDLVIMLISGGGSALLSLPVAPMTYIDERTLFETLTARGAPIQDVNIVRKHISHARGGALAVASYPAEVISLIVSDVPGGDIAMVASGPTIQDSSTVADAEAILKRYVIAPSEIAFLETPKDEKYFNRVTNTLLLSSQSALAAMQKEAAERGYAMQVVDTQFSGEARDIGRAIAEKLHSTPSKTALLYAGESTVTLGANTGKGGRNQELALAALADIRADELILPFASDGHDNTDYAGAIADERTHMHAGEKNISIQEHLDAHRSYDFFAAVGDGLVTGSLESNVSDLVIALKS